jgi:signal transduction histidine kinase
MKLKQEKEEDELMTDSLIKMENAISNITEQINDVMNFIRKPDMKFSTCNLKVLLTKTVEDMQFPEDVELELSVNSCIIKCDIIKIKGIITNILQNSIQAMKWKGKINLIATDSDNCVEINIVDSGPGIAKENIEKIFEPMFTTKPLGNGLGLASCKELVENHVGTISVKNNPTTFTLMLPKISD